MASKDDGSMKNPTADEAIELLPEGDMVHTFRSSQIGLLGADWERGVLIEAIRSSDCLQIGGGQCRSVGHGLVVWTDNETPLFVQTKAGALDVEARDGD